MEIFSFYNYSFSWVNLVDIALVLLISYQLYRLLKGSLAFNMLIGLITIYIFWRVVSAFNMPIMEGILNQFVKVGFIAFSLCFNKKSGNFYSSLAKARSATAVPFFVFTLELENRKRISYSF